jgi:hypothetical protein
VSEFLSPLRVEETDEIAGLWTLLEDFSYRSDLLARVVTVPQAFVTDFASVPRLPGTYLLAGGKGNKAAVVHDYLYTIGKAHPGSIDRETADGVLREAMRASGYGAAMAWAFYQAVRIGGASHWSADNNDQSSYVEAAMHSVADALRAGA